MFISSQMMVSIYLKIWSLSLHPSNLSRSDTSHPSHSHIHVKPWAKVSAGFNFCQFAFCLATYLRGHALTLVDFGGKCFSVWPPNVSRHKLIASHLYMREIYDLGEIESRLASPLGQGIMTNFLY